MLKTIVKISNVTNLSDARYCAGMGVDLLGFSMDKDTPDYVSPEKLTEIRSWVAGVHIVGETAATEPDEIEQLMAAYQPDVLQVDEAVLLPYLNQLGKPLILRVDLSMMTLEQLETLFATSRVSVEYFLLESRSAINFDQELLDLLKRLSARYPMLLGIGISADSVHALLEALPRSGIALTGGEEVAPGNKEFGELMDILEAIEVGD